MEIYRTPVYVNIQQNNTTSTIQWSPRSKSHSLQKMKAHYYGLRVSNDWHHLLIDFQHQRCLVSAVKGFGALAQLDLYNDFPLNYFDCQYNMHGYREHSERV